MDGMYITLYVVMRYHVDSTSNIQSILTKGKYRYNASINGTTFSKFTFLLFRCQMRRKRVLTADGYLLNVAVDVQIYARIGMYTMELNGWKTQLLPLNAKVTNNKFI